ncbi:RIP metalloprotease RseP [bacterium CG2_30_37_16]|nr:MAG: RIP metalloprotease RseP [bacterium CG2_30_37_16]PIP31166.1 MAG: RIP metalloprotease RseP [bacterium (Candidatus Howlettbacteria) CG23_combo_of_CG06-09_8_20_14_all_37_9]PIY00301.1 MAG: RIP metalloprotease RseP [bacterium (Candidatus Howlettbacteria) CG_4_10_14_3_um_filter_37_10]PJB06538.1 MAG: RIP metalloprotease RseP [bacterium (Candidatus Howlettbacteria) CG_4_9_14_3_um_filter_37_10]
MSVYLYNFVNILSFVFVFGLIVFVHEFGHFFMARRAGCRIEEFGFGFGPKLFSRKKGETEYAIKLFPIGGYVKIYGEEGDGNAKDPKNFASKTPLQKFSVLIAGVTMNLILAIIILTGIFIVGFKPLIPQTYRLPGIIDNQKVLIQDAEKDSPAEKAGIKGGWEVVSINEKKAGNSLVFAEIVNEKKDQNLDIILKKDSQTKEFNIKPIKDDKIYKIGVYLEDSGTIRAPFYLAPIDAVVWCFDLAKLTIVGFYQFLHQLFTSFSVSENVTGPVGIYKATGAIAYMGFDYLMQFTAIISLTLAIMNLLPIPALDGGHIFILGLEKITNKKFDEKAKNTAALVGFSLLILLMVVITWKDLLRFDIIKW